MPIHSHKNQYQGINAHLTSYLLNEEGGWHSFHSGHIEDLRRAIDAQLPGNYYARAEKSLQISEHDLIIGTGGRHRTIPDVTIYGTDRTFDRPGGQTSPTTAPTATLLVEETFVLEEEETLNSIVIYQIAQGETEDRPITRIELLSSSNKPPGSAYPQYLAKRKETLQSGVRVVELDYIHESRSPLLMLPSYPDGEPGAHPYLILVSDPRPSVQEGPALVYGFNVDEPIPVVDIPLQNEDKLTFDFEAVYNQTFSQNRFYTMRAVDYAQLPVNFDRYQPAGQESIQKRMAVVNQAVADGLDLEQGPFQIT